MLMTDLHDEMAKPRHYVDQRQGFIHVFVFSALVLVMLPFLAWKNFLDLRPALGSAGASCGPDLPSACRCVPWELSWF